MSSTLVQILLAAGILGLSALVMHLFARAMYLTCPKCRTLNARRRVQCRNCAWELRQSFPRDPTC